MAVYADIRAAVVILILRIRTGRLDDRLLTIRRNPFTVGGANCGIDGRTDDKRQQKAGDQRASHLLEPCLQDYHHPPL